MKHFFIFVIAVLTENILEHSAKRNSRSSASVVYHIQSRYRGLCSLMLAFEVGHANNT